MLLFITLGVKAQNVEGKNKNCKAAVMVDGNCEMCKARIEKSALKTKGVKYAFWDVNSKVLRLIYNQKKTSLEEIQQAVLEVGHDVDSIKAPLEVYKQLHVCCQYRE